MAFTRLSLPRTAALQFAFAIVCFAACGDDDSNGTPARDAGDVKDSGESSGSGGKGGEGGKGAGSGGASGSGGSAGDGVTKDAGKDSGEMPESECANGVVDGLEDCDDHNATNGDGCDSDCHYESGWSCSTDQPTVCEPRCGDAKRVGAETAADRCDDQGVATGDGCDAQCHVEAGWSCTGTPSVCARLCGNGALDGGEACDDGNAAAADGCAACALETHWQCTGAPSTCTADADANLLRSGGLLAAFSTLDPAHVQTPVALTGLVAGDTLVAIDRRPVNGMLYGLGYNATAGTAQLYLVSSESGVCSALGAPTRFTADDGSTPVNVSGVQFGMDFNPAADRARIVNNQGQNFRINPNTGAFIDGNGPAGLQPDGAVNGLTSSLDECAYTNNSLNASATTLYTLDHVTGGLYIQSPPNNGTQTMLLTLSPASIYVAGFDIASGVDVVVSNAAASGSGYVALRLTGEAQDSFAKINLATGSVTSPTPIGTNTTGLAIQNANALPVYALSTDGTQLWRFKSTDPGAAVMAGITGITAGETLVDIDFRALNGQLIGIGINETANTGSTYLIDPQSGAATLIGSASQIALVDSLGAAIDFPAPSVGWGIDFNPTVDRIRVVNATGLNFRVNPTNGVLADGSTDPGVNPDGPISGLTGGSVGLAGAAYTNAHSGATVTTLYLLDAYANSLCHSTNPNSGATESCVAVTSGSQPLDFASASEIDFAPDVRVGATNAAAAGVAYAALTVGGTGHLYTIDLTSGVAADLGQIGSAGPSVSGLTVGHATVK
jgi:cysteine-rich repeat protein